MFRFRGVLEDVTLRDPIDDEVDHDAVTKGVGERDRVMRVSDTEVDSKDVEDHDAEARKGDSELEKGALRDVDAVGNDRLTVEAVGSGSKVADKDNVPETLAEGCFDAVCVRREIEFDQEIVVDTKFDSLFIDNVLFGEEDSDSASDELDDRVVDSCAVSEEVCEPIIDPLVELEDKEVRLGLASQDIVAVSVGAVRSGVNDSELDASEDVENEVLVDTTDDTVQALIRRLGELLRVWLKLFVTL